MATFGLPTSPEASEFEIEPRFTAASPPSVVIPLLPAAPVTSPVANAFVMVPLLKPTRPPPLAFAATLTATAAQVWPAMQGWVSAGTVAPGAAVTVTLSSGAGGAWDWLALAASSAPNTSYVTYTFVGGGMTSRTWTVTMPSTPGTYEFRLFLNNGYARAATSPPVTVRVE